MFPSAQHDSYSQVVPLQQTHLCVFGHGVGKTHAKADETHRFSCAAEGFFEQSAKIFQCRRKACALGGRTCEIVELQLDRKSTRLNSSHVSISYAVFCLKKKIKLI